MKAKHERRMRRLLEALDSNGIHSGDVVAAAYFRQAAEIIRAMMADVERYRGIANQEKGVAIEMRARAMSAELALSKAQAVIAELTPDSHP